MSRPSRTSATRSALGFPRQLRLRKTDDYQRVQGGGRRVRTPNLLVLFLPGLSQGSRLGITVSRKVGGAVVRNRVKRWLREALRMERAALMGTWDVVFIAHPSAALAGFAVIRAEVRSALRRLEGGPS